MSKKEYRISKSHLRRGANTNQKNLVCTTVSHCMTARAVTAPLRSWLCFEVSNIFFYHPYKWRGSGGDYWCGKFRTAKAP